MSSLSLDENVQNVERSLNNLTKDFWLSSANLNSAYFYIMDELQPKVDDAMMKLKSILIAPHIRIPKSILMQKASEIIPVLLENIIINRGHEKLSKDILDKAKKDTLRYFHGNTKAIVRATKAEVAICTLIMSQKTDDDKLIKDVVEDMVKPRLEILKEKYIKGFNEVTSFINNAINNKQDISELLLNLNIIVEKDIPPHFIFTYTDLDDYCFSNKFALNAYDRTIYDAIISLFFCGHEYITVQMIFNFLSGGQTDQKVDTKIKDKILQSVKKLHDSEHTVSAPELDMSEKFSLLPSLIIDNPKLNGKRAKECIYIFDIPILYNIAIKSKNFITVDCKLMDTSNNVSSSTKNGITSLTENNITLKVYLLREIAFAKKSQKKKHSIKIRYESIFSYLGIPERDVDTSAKEYDSIRRKYSDIRTKVKDYLSFLKQNKFINKYEHTTKSITIYI